jgi:hypothetical protein
MKNRFVYFLPAAALFACIAWAATLSTDYDHKVDFGRYHTYSWLGVKAGNSLWQAGRSHMPSSPRVFEAPKTRNLPSGDTSG